MLYSLSLSFLYQRDKEAVLLWAVGIIPLESLYCNLFAKQENYLFYQRIASFYVMLYFFRMPGRKICSLV